MTIEVKCHSNRSDPILYGYVILVVGTKQVEGKHECTIVMLLHTTPYSPTPQQCGLRKSTAAYCNPLGLAAPLLQPLNSAAWC